ncbi:DUF305 domain-containing protein [Phycicoccus sonneratiae]|uniref:DUF305 domain-containing protein n=1 Tax=Phycicoccus sonneratiae TaxID=2807628 RepID=A0ABS2CN48_9MICO|nr:DUF305 domain-containing protein [Phycicoccus sonneraticus]MBM6401296.1 DUF305 domain-containing protein [Phycicoccus sonneraticus]
MTTLPFPTVALRRAAAGVAVVGALVGVVACSSGGGSAPAVTPATPSVPVLQPGRPGEPNATLTGSAAAPVTTPSLRPGDARFLTDMVTHHAQAIVMVDAVAGDLTDRQVASLASRIRDEQRPEIDAMAGYLEQRGAPVPPEATNPHLADHGAHSMPGMAGEKELRALGSATGVAADRLFLTLMIRHHQGALTMVEEHARQAADERVEEIAADIDVTQTKQIAQMRAMLARLR